MAKVYEGKLAAKGKRFGIIVSRFNEFISSKLLNGALDCLNRHGADEEKIEIVWTPGAFEIPVTAAKLAETKKYDAIICLGAIIKGDTPHYDYIASEVTKGIAQVSLSTKLPVVLGVITTDNLEQAIERAGTKAGNKGFDAALAAMEMVNLFDDIGSK